jgi:hypothetical protein
MLGVCHAAMQTRQLANFLKVNMLKTSTRTFLVFFNFGVFFGRLSFRRLATFPSIKHAQNFGQKASTERRAKYGLA